MIKLWPAIGGKDMVIRIIYNKPGCLFRLSAVDQSLLFCRNFSESSTGCAERLLLTGILATWPIELQRPNTFV